VGFATPEEELKQFLDAQPSWLRKFLQLDFSLSQEEHLAWNQSASWWQDGGEQKVREEYESILRRIPAQWREYRKRLRENALSGIPAGQPGRPRKDTVAEEAARLRGEGKSYAQIAIMLNHKYPKNPTSPEAVRKLLYSRKERPRDFLRGINPTSFFSIVTGISSHVVIWPSSQQIVRQNPRRQSHEFRSTHRHGICRRIAS
jgi:hypothetical protein